MTLLSRWALGRFCLASCTPRATDRTRAPRIGCHVKKLLAAYGLRLSAVACLMGDNVTFNAKLAKLLGLRLSKCLPHSRNLVVKAALKFFENAHNTEQSPPHQRVLAVPQLAGGGRAQRMQDDGATEPSSVPSSWPSPTLRRTSTPCVQVDQNARQPGRDDKIQQLKTQLANQAATQQAFMVA